jgi:hypothetical protein
VAGCCECSDKPSGFTKFGDFLSNFGRVSFSGRTLFHGDI